MRLLRRERDRKGPVSLKYFYGKLPMELILVILEMTFTRYEVERYLRCYSNQIRAPDIIRVTAALRRLRFHRDTFYSPVGKWYKKMKAVRVLLSVVATLRRTWSRWIDEWIHAWALRRRIPCPIGRCGSHSGF